MKQYQPKSKEKRIKIPAGQKAGPYLAEVWRSAFQVLRCPFAGCDLRTGLCKHADEFFDKYASKGKGPREQDTEGEDSLDQAVLKSYLDAFSSPIHNPYKFYTALKKLLPTKTYNKAKHLSREQIRIIWFIAARKLSQREVLQELGWNSKSKFERHLGWALGAIQSNPSLLQELKNA